MNRPVVTMSCLGRIGRFGNQVFQYAFLKYYARRHSLTVQTPPWAGQELFGHRDPAISHLLPVIYEIGYDLRTALLPNVSEPIQNCDLWGYFLLHTSYYATEKIWFRSLFQPARELADQARQATELLRSRGRTIVGLHLRRGDKATGSYAMPSPDAYHNWLVDRWSRLDAPVLFIASDDPANAAQEYAQFRPVLASTLGARPSLPPYYLDFHLLTQCDQLAISNSTFSFAACMLNERCDQFFRPMPETGQLVSFDPWNADPVLRDDLRARDYYDVLLRRTLDAVATSASDRAAEFRAVRREVADNWLGAGGNEGSLTVGYFGPLGRAHRECIRSHIRHLALDEADRAYHQELIRTLATGLPEDWYAPYALAAMLYCRPAELHCPHDLAAIPQFMREEYLSFLRGSFESAPNAARPT